MRVYELAKKWQTSSGEVLQHAEKLDIEVYSPISPVEASDAKRLAAIFEKRTPEQIAKAKEALEAARAKKKQRVKSRRSEESAATRVALDASHQRALEMDAKAKGKKLPEKRAEPVTPVAETKPAEKREPAAKPQERPAQEAKPVAAERPAVRPALEEKPAEKPAAKPVPGTNPLPGGKKFFKIEVARRPPAAAQTSKSTSRTQRSGRPARVHYEEEGEDEHLTSSDLGRLNRGGGARDHQRPRNASRNGKGHDNGMNEHGGFTGQGGRGNSRFDRLQNGGRYGNNRDNNRFRPHGQQQDAPEQEEGAVSADHVIQLRGAVIVKDLAEKLGLRPNRLIADLMRLNVLASINQHVEPDVATKVAEKYGFKVEIERAKRSTERRPVLKSEDADDDIPDDRPEDLLPRPPVITFLGHVDHGKTSLMDHIRHASVAKGEAGGITQHIGAYTIELDGRKITFLDTPGHAAFSAMRMRGAQLTDIAVIIIAADDGIMPQTKEAIAAARQAGVQIMVAINKCDLPTAKPDRVRQQLQGEGLTPEEWGGDIICREVSAHTGQGIDQLLEMILLQADMLELAANPNRRADGYVVEARLEPGSGPTATILVTGGTLNVGDVILCGEYFGKVRGLIDDRGRRVKSAGPSAAVKCMGLSGAPEAGAKFRVMLDEKRARELAKKTAEENKLASLSVSKATSLDALMRQMTDDDKRSLSVIIKADTQGSSEAICDTLREIKSDKVSLEIISESIGNVLATDVTNAAASHAIIVGFNVGNEPGVQRQARHDGVRINTFRIIYELLDHVRQCMLDLLPPEYKEVVKGHAEIRKAFDIGKTGRIAGCQMIDGTLIAKGHFRIFRGKEPLWSGKLLSLKHFQNEVAEVVGSQECGVHFNGFEGFQEGDTVECFALEELPRTL